MRDGDDQADRAFPFISRPDRHFMPYPTTNDDELSRGRSRYPRSEEFDEELDEIQQGFEALTRWSREAEWAARGMHARAASPRAEEAGRGREPNSPVLAGSSNKDASASSQDWRRIINGARHGDGQHPRAESDASVEVMDLATYTRQLQPNRMTDGFRPSHASRPSFAARPSTLDSPAPSYTSRFPSSAAADPAPSFRSLESYRSTMPRDDYDLPTSAQRAPAYEPFTPELFDARASHHVAAGDETDGRPTLRALKSFPKFSRKWFGGDDAASYEGIGREEWAGGGLSGDLADVDHPTTKPPSKSADAVKKARVRQLEREFGADRNSGLTKAEFRATQPLRVGDLDKRGRIVTGGPRKRAALRGVEGLLSLLALVLLIYSALFMRGIAPPPPPHATKPAFALYVWASLAVIAFIVLHAIYPLSCLPRDRKQLVEQVRHPSGGMVLPMMQPGGKRKKGRHGPPPPPAINVVVDPRFFAPTLSGRSQRERRHRDSSSSSTSGSDLDDGVKRDPRASFSDVLATRAEFSLARRWLTKLLVADVLIGLGWASTFGYCMTGPACPAGTSERWCDCWNAALAIAILLPLGHFTSAVLIFRDRKIQLLLHT